MEQSEKLSKLFGSRSRVSLLQFLFQNHNKKYRVNQIVRKTKVNSRLVSSELKKLAEIGILVSSRAGNALFYQVNRESALFNPLQSIFVESEWFKWERPARIHHLVIPLEAGFEPMKKRFGLNMPDSHLVFGYDNVTWFYKMNTFRELGKKLLPVYKRNKKKLWLEFESSAAKLWGQKTYPDFYKAYIDFWKVAWVPALISYHIDTLLKPGEQIAIEGESFTDEYEDILWELARKASKVGLENVDVKPILEKFFWIRNSYHGIHRLTAEEIRTEIEKKIGKRKKRLKKVKKPKSISKELVDIGKEVILMQDIRKKYMMRAAYHIHEFLKEIGEKYDLSPVAMAYTLPKEVLDHKNILPKLKRELKLRQRTCTVTASLEEGLVAYSGQKFFPKGSIQHVKHEIKGRAACGGKAAGRARVVMKDEDIYQVNHGDVIVSPMTSPNFMPAIRRSVAIVTDFGGITCHAAIISREFNLPCVVSTNNATELIEDGDLIEVDADKGLVKVLQKTS